MKSLQIPSILRTEHPGKLNLPTVYLILKVLLACILVLALLLAGHYFWTAALLVGGAIVGYVYHIYKEACAIDFSVGDINFTLADIIEDLEH